MRILPVVLLFFSLPALADEGMWTFNRPPLAQLAAKYAFKPTQQWLDHVRLASVRFNSGGSGSFVSPTGLVLTNHHVGADCINKLGKKDANLIEDGFYARKAAEELRCPDLELNVLVAISEVSKDVKSVEKTGMSAADINAAQKRKMTEMERDVLPVIPVVKDDLKGRATLFNHTSPLMALDVLHVLTTGLDSVQIGPDGVRFLQWIAPMRRPFHPEGRLQEVSRW